MAQHETSGKFDPAKEDWISYTERLQQYFTSNDMDDWNKQCVILLSACGPATYQLIRNLVAPSKLTSKSFQEIVDLVSKHHHPQPSVIVQQFHFHSRSRHEGESISAFVAELYTDCGARSLALCLAASRACASSSAFLKVRSVSANNWHWSWESLTPHTKRSRSMLLSVSWKLQCSSHCTEASPQ